MGHGLIIAGIAFLLIPTFGVYDVMPDFIGCALIMAGLAKTAKLNGDLQSSRRNFRYLLYITAARFLLMFPIVSLSDEMTSMLFVFAFAIAETVFLLPAFSELTEGSYYLSARNGCDIPDKVCDDFRLVTRIFIIARAVLVSVPELTVLTNDAYKESVDVDAAERLTLYDSKNVITMGCAAVSLFIGAAFFALAVRFFGKLMKDRDSVAAIRKRYEDEISSDRLRVAYDSVRSASSLFVAACVFLTTVHFYGFDVLPDVVAAVLMLFCFVKMKKAAGVGYAVPLTLFSAVYCALSFAAEFYVAQKYFDGSYAANSENAPAYAVSASAKALGFMIFAAVIYCFYRCLSDAARKYTKAPTFDEEGYKKMISGKCRAVGILGIAACGLSAAAVFASLYIGAFRFAGILIFGAYAIYAYIATSKICDEISRRI